MDILSVRVIIADVFGENGFVTWAQQARTETDPGQLRRLALRAYNTTPKGQRETVATRLIALLK